ncbi:SPOR domain-containing protein [Devosia faecipullorum]|uniref:SPOR domain-containing protein n=1 Tax=Devosia faecipullorum TaxID=2755039 RepID=UPI00187BB42B|nr:SPOR domain-containing protein [Devosia faecipullorum]MBE7731744.1 SPOR domain-containing protein [Devosia faecipullorum]
MAAQTDAPDDLIAELARLMADDARSDHSARTPQAANEPAPTVRIPGADTPPAAAAPVRIPGAPAERKPEADPFNFDFSLNDFSDRAAGPASTLAGKPAPVLPVAPALTPEPMKAAASSPDSEALDFDGLADLIAAELASDMTPPEPLPVADGPVRGEDNFGVPPVFGLGAPAARETAPEPIAAFVEPDAVEMDPVEENSAPVAAPFPERDPGDALTDIERLLAPVVQRAQDEVEQVRSPSPALRSLATPTLPPAEVPPMARHTEPGSVDDAILAAAAATGAHVEWVEPHAAPADVVADDLDLVEPRPRRGFALSRAVVGPLVAVGLLGVAGLGLYWVLGQGSTPTGPAPLLLADNNVVKEVPAPTETTSSQSVVFNEISGAGNAADEQIVPRDQADEAALSEAAIANSGTLISEDGTSVDPNVDGLVNRKVRTVTVRPDGTIISGADSMAGSSILPVERPNVPEVPGADFSTPDLIASAIASGEQAAASAPAAASIPVPTVAVVSPGSVVPVVDASGAALAGRSVTIPMDRPADFAQAAASALAAAAVPAASANGALVAPVAQPAAATPSISATTGGAAAYVQLASQRSEEAARQSAQSMATRYGVLFSGSSPEIQRVDLGERGIYYRVLVPAASRDAAANICNNIRAAGGDCLLL